MRFLDAHEGGRLQHLFVFAQGARHRDLALVVQMKSAVIFIAFYPDHVADVHKFDVGGGGQGEFGQGPGPLNAVDVFQQQAQLLCGAGQLSPVFRFFDGFPQE